LTERASEKEEEEEEEEEGVAVLGSSSLNVAPRALRR